MAFLQSWMLWGLLAVGVPVGIHLIQRRKAVRVPFPALEFILRSRKAVARKFRVKQLLLLALRCILVGAAAVAAARPLFPGRDASVGPSGGPAAVAVCIDRSLSMRARIGGAADATAFKAAADAARSLVNSLGPDVEAVIVPFSDDAKAIPSAPTADKNALLAALHDVTPGYGRTNVEKALDTAAAALAPSQKPRKLVYIFTDAAMPGWREVTPRDPQTQIAWRLIDVTSRVTPNAALTALEVHEEGAGATARAEVQNFSDLAAPGLATEISVNDKAAGRNFLDLAPGAGASTVFTLAAPPAGLNLAAARLTPDALPEDDVRYAVFQGRARVRTLLVDGDPKQTIRDAETFYLERALAPSREATTTLAPIVVDPEGLARANLAQYDVVILANVGTLPATLVASLKRWVNDGGGLMLTAGDRMEAEEANANLGDLLPMRLRGTRATHAEHTEGGAAEAPPLTLSAPASPHPVTSAIDATAGDVFSTTHFKTVELLEGGSASSGANVILRFSDGSPALVEKPLGRGRVALFASSIDREWNDLPISTLYLPLMRRMVRYLAGELGDQGTGEVLVGQAVKIEVGDRKSVRVEGPEGFAPRTVPAIDGAVEIEPPLPGVYRLTREDGTPDERLASKGFAVNVDTAESDLRKVTRAELARIFGAADFDTSGGIGEAGATAHGAVPDKPMWGMLLGLAVAALLLEGVVTGV